MNYYKASQRKDTKRWDYTCTNDNRTWPIGYCREDGGHETEQEARDCYKRYLLDNRLRLDGDLEHTQKKCEFAGCDCWTSRYAEVDMRMFSLCDEHRTREVVEKFFSVGESISSY